MDLDALVRFVQEHFSDGLALVIGSGLSAAEGIPGMPALAGHLSTAAGGLAGSDCALWSQIKSVLDANEGLEAALLKYPPSSSLEDWIVKETCGLLLPKEREVITSVLTGARSLRLTAFLTRILTPANGLPILTPNYDRLIEIGCEMASFHVDTTAIGVYAGAFDHQRSCMASCRGITNRPKMTVLEHFPRAIVLKPHGSFDWYRTNGTPRRCTLDLDADRLIITPGLNKYKAGYTSPFDKHRDLANDFINRAARLLIVGYGFNDDHLQWHLLHRIRSGIRTLILTRSASDITKGLAQESPACVCVAQHPSEDGVTVYCQDGGGVFPGFNYWDLGVLARELLA
jgi:hypothetical protein